MQMIIRLIEPQTLLKKKWNYYNPGYYSYCPLIWMFHSRIMNNEINRLHERCMRQIYEDKTSSFEELLEQNKSVSIHTRNLQMLVTSLCGHIYRSMPHIFSEIFRRLDICYNLRSNSYFAVPNVKSVFYGSESISYLWPKICDVLPLELKR